VTKRSHQAAARYAGRSGQRKRKRPPKPAPSPEAKLAPDKPAPAQAGVQGIASQQTEEPKQATEPLPKTSERLKAPAVAATYAYVASDLKRIGIITAAIFILLIVLVIIFG